MLSLFRITPLCNNQRRLGFLGKMHLACMQDNRRRNRRLRCRGLRPPSEMQRFMQQCCAFPLLLRRSLAVLALESGAMEGLCCGSSVPPPRLVEWFSRADAHSQTPKFLPFEQFKHGREDCFSPPVLLRHMRGPTRPIAPALPRRLDLGTTLNRLGYGPYPWDMPGDPR